MFKKYILFFVVMACATVGLSYGASGGLVDDALHYSGKDLEGPAEYYALSVGHIEDVIVNGVQARLSSPDEPKSCNRRCDGLVARISAVPCLAKVSCALACSLFPLIIWWTQNNLKQG
jgi:hypothetical protein